MTAVSAFAASVPQTSGVYRGVLEQSSQGTGPDAEAIRQYLTTWGGGRSTTQTTCTAEDVASRRFDLKAWLSSVAMHLESDTRKGLFLQLDRVLQMEDWEEKDVLPELRSWRTLARLIVYAKPKKMPALSFRNGNAVASWTNSDIRITVECWPGDDVSWVASRSVEGKTEASAGDAIVRRLSVVIAPYNDEHWLF